jgi:hypothetical protein
MVVALVSLVACGKGDADESVPSPQAPRPIDARSASSAPTDTELTQTARQQVDLLEQLAGAADATKGDCTAMSARVTAIVSANRVFYDRMAALIEDDDTAKKLDALGEPLRDRSEAAMRTLEPALTPCMGDPGLTEVMDSILL